MTSNGMRRGAYKRDAGESVSCVIGKGQSAILDVSGNHQSGGVEADRRDVR
jgi:hypothetical protein